MDGDTKGKALAQLIDLAEERRQSFDDDKLRMLFSDELVTQVFEVAWAHQWDRETYEFKRQVRAAVQEAVEAVVGNAD